MSTQRPSNWRRLFRIAHGLIGQVNRDAVVIDRWTFGGGTALMLQIGHRESHDIDIFLPDPQFLPFLNPETHEFIFEIMPADYGGDGSRFLKFAFADLGEIDFIAAPSLTENSSAAHTVEGALILLETVPEIVTKKIFYRGDNIKPRDIFDIAAAARSHAEDVRTALVQYPEKVEAAIAAMGRLNPEFVDRAVSALMINDGFKNIAKSSLGTAMDLLTSIQHRAG